MPTMGRMLVRKPDGVAPSATANDVTNKRDGCSSDNDYLIDEIARMIYNSRDTAKARAAAAANNTPSDEETCLPQNRVPSTSEVKKDVTTACRLSNTQINQQSERGGSGEKRKASVVDGIERVKGRCISHEGCTNQVQKEGVCIKHSTKVKLCSHEGCTDQAKLGGLCFQHVYYCNHEGCIKVVVKKGGVCIEHGTKVKLNCNEGCNNNKKKGGVCIANSCSSADDEESDDELGRMIYNSSETAKARARAAAEATNNTPSRSDSETTTNAVSSNKRKSISVHDEEEKKKKRVQVHKICSTEGCTNQVQKGGVCWKHGAKDTT